MADVRKWQESIQVGFQVFDRDGGEEFGAVRGVCPAGRLELLVNVENGGDHCIPLDAIVDVHSEKVIVDDGMRRVAYSVLDAPGLRYHHASMQVMEDGPNGCRFVWITDFLPADSRATPPPIGAKRDGRGTIAAADPSTAPARGWSMMNLAR